MNRFVDRLQPGTRNSVQTFQPPWATSSLLVLVDASVLISPLLLIMTHNLARLAPTYSIIQVGCF